MPSYDPSTIPTGINTSKEFLNSEYGDLSSDSITSFSETLYDDVLFYPDVISDDTLRVAIAGSTNYEKTFAFDDDWFTLSETYGSLNFSCATKVTDFSYYIYADGDIDCKVYINDGSQILLETTDSEDWYNGSYTMTTSLDEVNITLARDLSGQPQVIDYFAISYSYMSLADSNHYAESFADVSDWSYSWSTGLDPDDYSFTTDGDIGNLSITYDSGANEDVIFNSDSFGLTSLEYYIEIRYYLSDGTDTFMQLKVRDTSSSDYNVITYSQATTWTTYRAYLGSCGLDDIDKIRLVLGDVGDTPDSATESLFVDYIRISPTDECGFQYDGSIIPPKYELTTNYAYADSTDGDILSLDITRTTSGGTSYSNYEIIFDGTTTPARLDRDYYPFFVMRWRCTSFDATKIYPVAYFDGYRYDMATTFGHASTFDWEIVRFNIASLTDAYSATYDGVRFILKTDNQYEYADIDIDYIKAYSIADFNIGGLGSTGINEYLQVQNNAIVATKTSVYPIYLNAYVTPNIDEEIYTSWQLSTSNYATDAFKFVLYYSGSWHYSDYDQLEGYTAPSIGDWHFDIYKSLTLNSIKFLDSHQWHLVDDYNIYFLVPFDTWGFDMFLIFVGLIMIIISTCYLVYGGRSNFSTTKIFWGFLLFAVGVGLFIGGIT